MADLKTTLCGIEMDSPFVLGSGPAGFDAEALAAASKAGAGAVVTKSIAVKPFVNPTQHMICSSGQTLMNNEGGSDLELRRWIDVEIPKAKALGVKVLIASVYGYGSREDTLHVAQQCEKAGADILEVVTGYSEAGGLVELVSAVKSLVKIPVIVKVNGNWRDTGEIAHACDAAGADGITAIDSIGPVYRVDIATGKPLLGGSGYGYMSGASIFPIAMRFVHDIASGSNKDLIGLGGVTGAETAMEMLMAGATACGVCSLAVLQGAGVFTKLCKDLSGLMDRYGYPDVASVSRRSFAAGTLANRSVDDFFFDPEKCVHCNRCIKSCAYRARRFGGEGRMEVDRSVCRVCGLCFTVCAPGAIGLN
jgi:dihydroorotate dehydrogenase (fumarate)